MKTCLGCGQPTQRAAQAKRCLTCARQAFNARTSAYMKAHPHVGRKASKRWNQQHPDTVKAMNARPGRHRISRYGLSEVEFAAMLTRQGYRCLGCQRRFDRVRLNIDHDHQTNKVRGLLCHGCNAALGLLEENKETLTRLRAYLDYDRAKTHIYVTGSLRNPAVIEVGHRLRKEGYEVVDDWIAAGPDADTCWQQYETAKGHTYQEALHGRAAENVFNFDLSWVDLCDIGILVMPAGKSSHLELGYMTGQGKPTYILQPDTPERFEVMPQFAAGVYTDLEDLCQAVKRLST